MDSDLRRAKIATSLWRIGQTSERYESSSKGADVISSGKGDHGGVSYGKYQLSTKMGTLQEYLNQSTYRKEFAGLIPATPEFNAKWIELARSDSGFSQDQHDFIGHSHFMRQLYRLKEANIDLSGRGRAVHDSIWSTSVQFGNKTTSIFHGAGNHADLPGQ